MNPGISFIIPVLNGARTLPTCLAAIREQEGLVLPWEIIVVDNGSTDDTLKLLEEESGLRVLHEPNRGRPWARNRGAAAAQYSYLAFIDCDTFVAPNWASALLRALVPPWGLAQAPVHVWHGPDAAQGVLPSPPSYFIFRGLPSSSIDSAACMIPRELFRSVGGYETQLERCEDTHLAQRLTLLGHGLLVIQGTSATKVDERPWYARMLRSLQIGASMKTVLDAIYGEADIEPPLPNGPHRPWRIMRRLEVFGQRFSRLRLTTPPNAQGWAAYPGPVVISRQCFFLGCPHFVSLRLRYTPCELVIDRANPGFNVLMDLIETGRPFIPHFLRLAAEADTTTYSLLRSRILETHCQVDPPLGQQEYSFMDPKKQKLFDYDEDGSISFVELEPLDVYAKQSFSSICPWAATFSDETVPSADCGWS